MGEFGSYRATRREFVGSLTPLLAAGLAFPSLSESFQEQDKPGFWSTFTPQEQRTIAASTMARDVQNYAGHGFGCAECCYVVALRYLGEPEARLDAATVFNGGLGQGDLCGMLTGSMLAIGVAAGKLHQDRTQLRRRARQMSNEYWDWWLSRGSVHCSELRRMYQGGEEFLRMAQRAVSKVEELIEAARNST
jgi:hypothetical protein